MSQYFQRIRESVSTLVFGTNRGAKRPAPDDDTDHHDLTNPARKRRDIPLIAYLAYADGGTEEIRRTFDGQPFSNEADEIRTNDPRRTTLHLGFDFDFEEGISDDAARLLGRYITTNEHLTQLHIHNGFGAIDTLFEGLRGSRSLVKLAMYPALSEKSLQTMLPLLSWARTPKLKDLQINLGSAPLRPILRTLNGRSIESLSLRGDAIRNISEIGSCNLPNLNHLCFETSGMTSVPSLHGFLELRTLSLSCNSIDRDGLTRLNAYLASDSCQICSLTMADTGMADEDISSLTQALKLNRSILGLYLSGNDCGEAGYRSILKMLLDISSIKATIESNTRLHRIALPIESDYRDEYASDFSDSDASEYYARDGYEEIRKWIHSVLDWNFDQKSPRERIIETHLNARNRRQLCEMQGVDYSYDSLFAEIPPCAMPELFATLGEDPGEMDPLRALVATVASWTSLVDRRLMVESTLERNRAQVERNGALVKQLNDTTKQLNGRNEELEEKLKDIESSNIDDRLSGSKRPYGQLM